MTKIINLVTMLVAFSVLAVSGQKWGNVITVAESNMDILFQKHFLDQTDKSAHFIYAVRTKLAFTELFYRKMTSEGVLGTPLRLFPNQKHLQISDISGAHDGSTIFIAGNVRRNNSQYYDVYFMESTNGGKTFSSPVAVPRDKMDDEEHRFEPNIRYSLANERIWIGYRKGSLEDTSDIAFVSRPKGSSIFSKEKSVSSYSGNRTPLRFEIVDQMNDVTWATFLTAYGRDRLYTSESINNGVTWNTHSYDMNRMGRADVDYIVNQETPKTWYGLGLDESLTSYAYYGRVDVQEKYGIPPNAIAPGDKMIRAKLCRAVTSYQIVTLSAGNRDEITGQIGTVYAWDPLKNSGTKYASPFASTTEIKHSYGPDLSCWYIPSDKQSLLVSVIGMKKDGSFVLLASFGSIIPGGEPTALTK